MTRMRMRTFIFFLTSLVFFGLAGSPLHAGSEDVEVSMFAVDSETGETLDGTFSAHFCFLENASDTTCLYEEDQTLSFDDGIARTNVPLDSLSDDLPDSLVLKTTIDYAGGQEFSLDMQAVPWAIRANICEVANSVANDAVTSVMIAPGTIASSDLSNSGVTAGTYTNATVTVNSQGLVTSAATGAAATLGVTVESAEITDATIAAADLAGDSVTSAKILDGTITAADLGTDSVAADEIAADGVGAAEIAAGAVGASEISDNTVDATELAAALTFVDGDFLDLSAINASSTTEGLRLPQAADVSAATAEGQMSWDTDGDALFVGTGAAVVQVSNPFGATIDSADITDGTIVVADVGTDAVAADEIAADAVGTSELAPDSVTTAEIALDTILAADIAAGAVGTSEIANDTVTGTDIDESTLVLTGLVDDDDLAAGAVDGGTGGEIADGSITAADLGTDSVAADEIAASAVGTSEIANDTVTGTDIDESTLVLTGLVDDDDLAAAAVDGGTGGEIADGSITAADLGTDSVAADEIATGAVGTLEVALDALDFVDFEDTLDIDDTLIINFPGTTTTGWTYNATSLTSGNALTYTFINTATSDAVPINPFTVNFNNSQSTAASSLYNGVLFGLTHNPSIAANTNESIVRVQLVQNDAATADDNVAAGLRVVNADTAAGDQQTLDDAVLIEATVDGTITDGIDVSDPEITNAINVGANTITGTTPVIDFTNFDVTATGSVTAGGNVTVTKADPAIVLNVTTATDTDFWVGVTDDGGSDDDDLFQIGEGTTPGTTPRVTIDTDGDVGVGNTAPPGRFIVSPPAIETIANLATITANGCGTVKRITADSAIATNATDSFTTPSATFEGCCMDVINVGTNSIRLDDNSLKTDVAGGPNLGQWDVVRVCCTSDAGGTFFWYMAGPLVNNL